jgi:hypothetical protein
MLGIILRICIFILIFVSSAWAGEEKLIQESCNRFKPLSVEVDGKGNIWTAYYDSKNAIHIKNLSDGIDLIVNEGRESISEGLSFEVQGDYVFVVWMEIISGRKRLYFRTIHDNGKSMSEPVLIDDNTTEAFTRIKIRSDTSGNVHVLWYGGRKKGDAFEHLYSVSSHDFGRTFSEIKNMTRGYDESIYPALLVDEKNAYMFSYSSTGFETNDVKRYMIFRKTEDGGRTWSEPVEIGKIGVVTLFIEPIKVGDRLHVFWFNSYDIGSIVPIVEGAYSEDGGKTWVKTAIEETRGFDIGHLRVAHDSKGHIYLALSGKWEFEQKEKAYVIRSEDNGTTWEKMIPIRHYPFDITTVTKPDILATEEGEVVVIWADFRNIRSNLYMQYSKDYGRTWQDEDTPLEEPGRYNTAHYAYTDSLIKIDDKYYVLAYRFKNDNVRIGEAYCPLVEFTLEDGGKR